MTREGPVVVLTRDARAIRPFWLTDHIPEVVAVDVARFPTLDQVIDILALGSIEMRAATSGLALTDPGAVQRGLDRLETDLANRTWDQRYGPCVCRPSAGTPSASSASTSAEG